MRLKLFISAVVLFGATNAFAQHSDVEFGYDNTANPTGFIIEQLNVTTDGIQYFESEFEEDAFAPGQFSSDEPGFATEAAAGLLVNPGDDIYLTVLDASINSSFGVGYVNYFDPATCNLSAAGRLSIIDDTAGTSDLVLQGAFIESGDPLQLIERADAAGDIHNHVVIDLLDDATAPLGAYGILVQMEADFSAGDGVTDLASDPFWIVFNHGMDEELFDSKALPAFGVSSVPEPASGIVLLAGLGFVALRRRRN